MQAPFEPEFHGFTEDDVNEWPQKVALPLPIYDIQLTPDLFIRTTAPAEAIKQIIMPKKVVKLTGIPEETASNAVPARTERKKNGHRFSPHPGDEVENPRRSERVAAKRTKRCSSIF